MPTSTLSNSFSYIKQRSSVISLLCGGDTSAFLFGQLKLSLSSFEPPGRNLGFEELIELLESPSFGLVGLSAAFRVG